jgi:hypothetical protein
MLFAGLISGQLLSLDGYLNSIFFFISFSINLCVLISCKLATLSS